VSQSLKRSGPAPARNVPSWYADPPILPDTLVARGQGRSKDEQTAVDKAVAEARSALADSIDHRWRSLLKAIAAEGGAPRSVEHEPVVLKGSIVLRQQVLKRGKTWTAFALAALWEGSARDVLLDRLHRNAAWYEKVRGTEAVRALEMSAP
jgi:hypothetical protein